MEIIGKIIQELPLQQGTSARNGNPWMIKTVILETQEQYPHKVAVEIFGEERINNNPCKVDDICTISFDLESREFNGKWYTSVRAWKIQQGVVEQPQAQQADQVNPVSVLQQGVFAPANEGDTLPF